MAATAGAANFCPHHPVRGVGVNLDRLGGGGLVEARPAGTGLELRVRAEERRSAPGTVVHAVVLHVPVPAGERPLSPLAAKDLVLLRRQLLAPLGVGLLDLVRHPFGSGPGPGNSPAGGWSPWASGSVS